MNLYNPYAFDVLGNPAPVAAPPVLRLENGQTTVAQVAQARAVFARYCDGARLSQVPNPVTVGKLADGSPYRITVVGAQTIMQIWPLGSESQEKYLNGIKVLALDKIWLLEPRKWRDTQKWTTSGWNTTARKELYGGLGYTRYKEGESQTPDKPDKPGWFSHGKEGIAANGKNIAPQLAGVSAAQLPNVCMPVLNPSAYYDELARRVSQLVNPKGFAAVALYSDAIYLGYRPMPGNDPPAFGGRRELIRTETVPADTRPWYLTANNSDIVVCYMKDIPLYASHALVNGAISIVPPYSLREPRFGIAPITVVSALSDIAINVITKPDGSKDLEMAGAGPVSAAIEITDDHQGLPYHIAIGSGNAVSTVDQTSEEGYNTPGQMTDTRVAKTANANYEASRNFTMDAAYRKYYLNGKLYEDKVKVSSAFSDIENFSLNSLKTFSNDETLTNKFQSQSSARIDMLWRSVVELDIQGCGKLKVRDLNYSHQFTAVNSHNDHLDYASYTPQDSVKHRYPTRSNSETCDATASIAVEMSGEELIFADPVFGAMVSVRSRLKFSCSKSTKYNYSFSGAGSANADDPLGAYYVREPDGFEPNTVWRHISAATAGVAGFSVIEPSNLTEASTTDVMDRTVVFRINGTVVLEIEIPVKGLEVASINERLGFIRSSMGANSSGFRALPYNAGPQELEVVNGPDYEVLWPGNTGFIDREKVHYATDPISKEGFLSFALKGVVEGDATYNYVLNSAGFTPSGDVTGIPSNAVISEVSTV